MFAHNLADAAGVSAAIVRKDFSLLEIYGQKRGGYDILFLIAALGKILGKTDEPQNIIIVGMRQNRAGSHALQRFRTGWDQDHSGL